MPRIWFCVFKNHTVKIKIVELFGMIQAIGRPCLVGQGQTVAIGFRQWNAFGLCFLGKGWDAEPKKKEQIQDSHGARYEGDV